MDSPVSILSGGKFNENWRVQTAYRSSNIRRARPACKPSACDGCRAENGSCSPTEAAPARAWTPNTCSCYPVLPVTVETLVKDQDNSGLRPNLWVLSFQPRERTWHFLSLYFFPLSLSPHCPRYLQLRSLGTYTSLGDTLTLFNSRTASRKVSTNRRDDSSFVQQFLTLAWSDLRSFRHLSQRHLNLTQTKKQQHASRCDVSQRDVLRTNGSRGERFRRGSFRFPMREPFNVRMWRDGNGKSYNRRASMCLRQVRPLFCPHGILSKHLPRSWWHLYHREDAFLHFGTYWHTIVWPWTSRHRADTAFHRIRRGLRTNFIPHSTTLGMMRERVGSEPGIDVGWITEAQTGRGRAIDVYSKRDIVRGFELNVHRPHSLIFVRETNILQILLSLSLSLSSLYILVYVSTSTSWNVHIVMQYWFHVVDLWIK